MLARRPALVIAIAIGICLAAAVTAAAPARGAVAAPASRRAAVIAAPSRAVSVTAATRQAAAASPAARACHGLPAFNAATAGQIMAGQLAISPFPVVTVDPRRDGGVNWSLNPYHDPTWVLDFRQATWIEQLISGYRAGGPRAAAYLRRAAQVTAGWLRAVPVSARDPLTLVCLAQAFPGQAWITGQVAPTVNWYAAHWQGAYNHGLTQDVNLLRIGCAYPAAAFGGDALSWRKTAVSQMTASFGPNQYGPAIDAQGAVNEQATLYENFVYNLWKIARPLLASCGYALPGWITGRIAALPRFLGYATQPDGNLVQIGDTYVERPARHPVLPGLVAVYHAGYVFGRSSWAPSASFYSLRFGPGREIHGHEDHMGLTYYARGRNLIVDAGHYGYAGTPYRTWLISPEAASTLVMPGVAFDPSAPTSLLTDKIGASGQFYEFRDTAFDGLPRTRSVYVSQKPDLVVVYDQALGPSARAAFQQLWHLDPALTVTRASSAGAVATAPGTELALLRVPLPGQKIPAGSTTVVRGQASPYQGWVSRQLEQQAPADTVEMTGHGPSAAMLTVIVPAAPGTPVTAAASGKEPGPWTLTVRVGSKAATFTLTIAGVITRR